jgi:small subunit ribosomal protein S9
MNEEKKEEKKSEKKKKQKEKQKEKIVITRGKRKRAIAIARIKKGKRFRFIFNGLNVDEMENEYLKQFLYLPVVLYPKVYEEPLDIVVNAKGGGVMGQLQAARRAVALGISNYFEDKEALKMFYSVNPNLVVEDVRRVEPKKDRRRKARAKYQKSYR